MANDYQRLWEVATNATDPALAIRSLAEILADKDGRAFVSRLDSGDAELCVEILADVSHDPHPPYSQPQTVSLGHPRTYPQTRRETSFLRPAEETG